MIKEIVQYVGGFGAMSKNPWYELMAKKGSVYDGAPQDHGFARGTPKECFVNAIHLAAQHELLYAEGYATHRLLGGFPIEHAWCVDSEGEVVDTTWCYPDAVYFGLVFRPSFAVRAVRQLGHYGLGHNLWRAAGKGVWKRIQKEYADNV